MYLSLYRAPYTEPVRHDMHAWSWSLCFWSIRIIDCFACPGSACFKELFTVDIRLRHFSVFPSVHSTPYNCNYLPWKSDLLSSFGLYLVFRDGTWNCQNCWSTPSPQPSLDSLGRGGPCQVIHLECIDSKYNQDSKMIIMVRADKEKSVIQTWQACYCLG